jgi:hypothetical protein
MTADIELIAGPPEDSADIVSIHCGHASRPREIAAILAGGALRNLLRAAMAEAFPQPAMAWPTPTFAVNVVAPFLLGYYMSDPGTTRSNPCSITDASGRFLQGGHPLHFTALLDRNVVLEVEDVDDDRDNVFHRHRADPPGRATAPAAARRRPARGTCRSSKKPTTCSASPAVGLTAPVAPVAGAAPLASLQRARRQAVGID